VAQRRYFKMDAEFFASDLADAVYQRFGGNGLLLFIAFLAACKRNNVPGRMSYMDGSTSDLLNTVGLAGLRLENEEGEPWTVDEFWTFLGRRKQVSRTRRGRLVNVVSSRWNLWQTDWKRDDNAERKRRSRGKTERDSDVTEAGQAGDTKRDATVTDRDLDLDVDVDPPSGVTRKRATQLPDSWTPTETHQNLAAELGVLLVPETVKFRDHAKANGRAAKDWDAAFRNWLRKAAEYGGKRTPVVPPHETRDRHNPNKWLELREEPA
jgi:hypothetical protein